MHIKVEPAVSKLKNIGSWSSLAALSKQSGPSGAVNKQDVTKSFAMFKKQAQEKEEKVSRDKLHFFCHS